jgi:hypothetical protein
VVHLVDIILVKADPIINQTAIRGEQIISSLSKKYSILAPGWNKWNNEGTRNELDNEESGLQLFNVRAPMVMNDLVPYVYLHTIQFFGYGFSLSYVFIDPKVYMHVSQILFYLVIFIRYYLEES